MAENKSIKEMFLWLLFLDRSSSQEQPSPTCDNGPSFSGFAPACARSSDLGKLRDLSSSGRWAGPKAQAQIKSTMGGSTVGTNPGLRSQGRCRLNPTLLLPSLWLLADYFLSESQELLLKWGSWHVPFRVVVKGGQMSWVEHLVQCLAHTP